MRNHDLSELTEACDGIYVGETLMVMGCSCKRIDDGLSGDDKIGIK